MTSLSSSSANISSSCTSIASTVTEVEAPLATVAAQEKVLPKKNNNSLVIGLAGDVSKRLSFDSSAGLCLKCKNSFKSCEFCQQQNKGDDLGIINRDYYRRSVEPTRSLMMRNGCGDPEPLSYNPVYNIREIRTVCHSFSSLGIDKKLLDIQINKATAAATNKAKELRAGAAAGKRSDRKSGALTASSVAEINCNNSSYGSNKGNNNNFSKNKTTTEMGTTTTGKGMAKEQVNANGNFVYI